MGGYYLYVVTLSFNKNELRLIIPRGGEGSFTLGLRLGKIKLKTKKVVTSKQHKSYYSLLQEVRIF